MNLLTSNLESLRWNHELALTAVNQISILEMYRDEVVRPSLRLLGDKLEAFARSHNAADVFAHDDFSDLHHSTVEGFLLTTQAMWERGLRGMMVEAATRQRADEKTIESIKSARWAEKDKVGVQAHFSALFGASLEWFGCYRDLHVLQEMGNALRHGDGRSAVRLHKLCPSLWTHWLPPGTIIPLDNVAFRVPDNAPRHPSFDNITLTSAVLEQMMLAVLWFWQDVEFVRCNSFTRKGAPVVRMLERMRAERAERDAQRLWTPN